jgi:LPXTG-motif cell wall-anchored protein
MNDILARRARRATVGIALSAALVAGIAPVTAIAAETSSPTGAVALQTEDAAAAKEKAYAAMQEALKNLEAAKDAAGPEILETIEHVITDLQSLRDRMLKEADDSRGPLLYLQANVDAAQAKYDEAHDRTSGLQAELNKAIDDGASNETIKQLQSEIMSAERREKSCEDDLHRCQRRLESQESVVAKFEANAEKCQTDIDEETAKRDALLDNLKKAQTAYDDACKAYEEAKAAADKATSPEITQPTETTSPSNSTQPTETTQPTGSSATGKDTSPNSTKQANSSSGKQADTTADKLANTGDTTPSAIALAGIATAGLGITATATRRIRNSK